MREKMRGSISGALSVRCEWFNKILVPWRDSNKQDRFFQPSIFFDDKRFLQKPVVLFELSKKKNQN